MSKCPKCSAEYQADDDCRSRFEQCLALEYENPTAFGAVHHLTVTCYMLQHNEYSHQAWLDAREMLRQFVVDGVAPAVMRKRNQDKLRGAKRRTSITKGARVPKFDAITWTRTIADVRLNDAEDYCADVKQWAAAVLADTQRCIQETQPGNITSYK